LLATQLDQERLVGQRQIVLVQLMKALGGGWHRDALAPNKSAKLQAAHSPSK
jgi:outer membrane protein TolC